MGGYVTLPGRHDGVLLGKPLVLRQRRRRAAGLANKVLRRAARPRRFGFPRIVRKKAQGVGNPVRAEITAQGEPTARFAGRTGPLRLLVVGGSLGRARRSTTCVPKALALIAPTQRPQVTHQSGAKQIDELRANYEAAGVEGELSPFIDDTARAYADADLIVAAPARSP